MTWIVQQRIIWIIVALVVVLRFPTLLESMYLVDDASSAAVANELLYGGTIYQTVESTRAPFLYYLYYGIFLIAGQNNLLAVHVVALLFVIATAWTIRRIGVVIASAQAGNWAAIGYVIFSHTYLPRDTLAANVEIFTVLPLTLCMLSFLIGERQNCLWWLFTSGLFCGVASFFRQPSLINLGVIGGYLGYICWIARTADLRHVIRSGSAVLAGFLTFVGGMFIYHQAQGNWNDMIQWAWIVAMRYVESETTVAYVIKRLFLVHGAFILAGGLLWYFGVKQFVTIVREHLRGRSSNTESVLIALWCAATYLSLFTGWRFPGHYHLTVLPSLAILAGIAFTQFLDRLTQVDPSKVRRIRCVLVSAAVIPAIGFLVMAFIIRKDTVAFMPITDYIVAHTQPEDRIFVWGSAPYIYSYSGRRAATRFVGCTHLVGMYSSRPHRDIDESKLILPGSWDMLAADWKAHPPKLIIDMSPVSNNWELHPMRRYSVLDRLLKNYSHETTVNGVPIYRRNT
jgi:hypothetical protein